MRHAFSQWNMASIQRRKRAGGYVYRAEIRIKRGGRIVHQESRTFNYKGHARTWASKREAELNNPGAIGKSSGMMLGELARMYADYLEDIRPIHRSKLYTFDRIVRSDLGHKPLSQLAPADVIEYAKLRASEGAGPSTVGAEVMWIGETLRMADPVFSVNVTDHAVVAARPALKQLRLVGKSRVRTRRLEGDEEARLLRWFEREDGRAHIPMADIFRFALSSAMRQGEITKILWADLKSDRRTIVIRDRKDPSGAGRDDEVPLMGESMAIIERQPVTADRIFPFNPRSIGARFRRACKKSGIVGLHFHDLRREAATRLLEQGYSVPEVILVTGHRDWNQFRRYVGLRVEDLGR